MILSRHPRTSAVILAAIKVHQQLGPGLLESAYHACLVRELTLREIAHQAEVPIGVSYEGLTLECGYRADLVVEGDLLVEIKSVERLLPIHVAQVLTYLRLTGARQALLMNFGQVTLKAGLRSYLGRGNDMPVVDDVGTLLPAH